MGVKSSAVPYCSVPYCTDVLYCSNGGGGGGGVPAFIHQCETGASTKREYEATNPHLSSSTPTPQPEQTGRSGKGRVRCMRNSPIR